MFSAMLFHTRFCQDLSKKFSAHVDAIFKLREEMADSSSDESGSENELDEIFGESSDEEDFEGFVFEMPDDIEWEKDPSGAAFQSYYEDYPCVACERTHCGPTVDQLPGSGKVIDILKLFLSDEFLNKIARWTNRWFEVKKVAELVCMEKRRRCTLSHPDTPKNQVPCKMTKTTFKCDHCEVYLCINTEKNCFKAWHTQAEYWKDQWLKHPPLPQSDLYPVLPPPPHPVLLKLCSDVRIFCFYV